MKITSTAFATNKIKAEIPHSFGYGIFSPRKISAKLMQNKKIFVIYEEISSNILIFLQISDRILLIYKYIG